MNEFLKIEYEQCLNLLRYYDQRHESTVKYCAAMTSAVPSLLLAIYQLDGTETAIFWKLSSVISIATVLGLLALYTVLVQTRLYFVYPARQVNAIRRTALESQVTFTNNQMYLDTEFNAFKWTSTQTLLNLFVAMQIGLFIALTYYSLCINAMASETLLLYAVEIGIFSSLLIFLLSARYLIKKSKQHPDTSVHGKQDK